MLAKSILICIVYLAAVVIAQNRKCIVQDNCEKCLLIDSACAWCTDRNYNLKKPRCMTIEELNLAGCKSVYQNNYVGLEILENNELRDYSFANGGGKFSSNSSSSSFSASASSASSNINNQKQGGGQDGQEAVASVIQIQPQRLKLSVAKGKSKVI